MTNEEINKFCDEIEAKLQKRVNPDMGVDIKAKLEWLSAVIGNMPLMIANSQSEYSKKVIYFAKGKGIQYGRERAKMTEEFVLAERVSRLDREIHESIGALRSLLKSQREDG